MCLDRFWANALRVSTPTFQRRFIDAFQEYTDSVVQQALDRDRHTIPNIEQYFNVRRDTIGVKPSVAMLEIRFDIPNEVSNHPAISALRSTCVDMIAIGNDLFSYNVE